MSALFGALGSLAESYGLARQDVMEQRQREAQAKLEEERMRQEGVRTQLEQARLKQEQALANRPMFVGQPYTRGGKEYVRQWEPDKAKISEIELGPAGESELAKVKREVEATTGKPFAPTEAEAVEIETGGKVKPPTTGVEDPDIVAGARAAHYMGMKPTGKNADKIYAYMWAQGWGMGHQPTGMETRTIEATKVAEERTRALRKFIEDNNLTESNSWGTLLERYGTSWEYLRGRKPSDPISQQLNLVSSAVSYLGALPYMQGRQGQYYMKVIGQHMPQMHDTPANMYDKSEQMMKIFDAVKRAQVTRGSEWTPGGTPGSMEPPITDEIPGGGDESPTPSPPIRSAAPARPRPVIHFNPDGSMEIR